MTPDGSWKLGGLEFLSRYFNCVNLCFNTRLQYLILSFNIFGVIRLADMTPDALQKKRARRYEKAVPPEEDSRKSFDANAIDTFAFGVLVDDVFRRVPDGMVVENFYPFTLFHFKS